MSRHGTVTRERGIDGKPCEKCSYHLMHTDQFGAECRNEQHNDDELKLDGASAKVLKEILTQTWQSEDDQQRKTTQEHKKLYEVTDCDPTGLCTENDGKDNKRANIS